MTLLLKTLSRHVSKFLLNTFLDLFEVNIRKEVSV